MASFAALERLAMQIRPFEAAPGTVDRLYAEAQEHVGGALARGKNPYRALRDVAGRFRQVETVEADKPRILVVGENYVRNQPFANCHVVRNIESLGGVANMPTFIEWVHHVNHCMRIFAGERSGLLKRVGHALARSAMQGIERKVDEALAPAWRDRWQPHVERLWENSLRAGFVPFFGDASLAVGLAVEMAERGVDGVVNVMPFTCMPQSIARSQLRRAATLLGGVPVLDFESDGRGEELLREELEMFMDQVKERHRWGKPTPRSGPRPRADIDRRLRSLLRI
jgi:predicted nucleotide-binding protein (sugar kinase/HSP70/actin superfamily)